MKNISTSYKISMLQSPAFNFYFNGISISINVAYCHFLSLTNLIKWMTKICLSAWDFLFFLMPWIRGWRGFSLLNRFFYSWPGLFPFLFILILNTQAMKFFIKSTIKFTLIDIDLSMEYLNSFYLNSVYFCLE